MRGTQLAAASALLAAAVGIGALVALRRPSKVPPPDPGAPRAPAGAEVILPAGIRAQHVIPVRAPVAGTVEELLVDAGDQVYEGQLIGRIRNTTLDADQQAAAAELEGAHARLSQLENQLIVARADASRARSDAARAQAEFDRADQAYQRQQMLVKQGATPRLVYEKAAREFDAAKTERDTAADLARGAEDRLESVTNSLDLARRSVQDGTATLERGREAAAAAEIHSPATGIVAARTSQVGDEVVPDAQAVFEIATDLAALEAVLEPPAKDLIRIRAGQEALITVADSPDPVAAQVSEVQGNQVRIRFTSPSPALRPGITAQIRIKLR